MLGVPLRFGIGYALPETETVPYVPAGTGLLLGRLGRLGHPHGPRRRTTISYMMNKMGPGIIGSDRSEAYVRAILDCLA